LSGEIEAGGGDFFAESVHSAFVGKFFAVEFEALVTDLGANGKIGQFLEGEELGGSVVAGGGEVVGGFEDGIVDCSEIWILNRSTRLWLSNIFAAIRSLNNNG
jgi:hypothetical protein